MNVEAYPLQWPTAWKRTPAHQRQRDKFTTSFAVARDGLLNELRLMGVARSEIVISSNVPIRKDGLPYAVGSMVLPDPGICVYFTLDGRHVAMPCDKWRRVDGNLQAIRKTIEALRGLERWGARELVGAAFAGFEALPAGGEAPGWWSVLGVSQDASPAEIGRAYRRRLMECHPDKGGDPEQFHTVQVAYRQARGVTAA